MAATTYQGDPTAVMGRRVLAYILDAIVGVVILLALLIPMLRGAADKEVLLSDRAASQRCDQVNRNTIDREDSFDDGSGGANFTFKSGEPFCINIGDTAYLFTADDGAPIQRNFYLLSFGWTIANSIVLQGLTGGSLGKLVVGIRVVREGGQKAGFGWLVLRTILLFIDAFCCFLPGLVVALASKGHRRIGDMAAGTFVVKRGAVGQPLYISGLTQAPPSTYGTTGGYGGAYQPQPQPQAGGWAPPATPGAPTSWDQPAATGGWNPPAADATAVAPGATPGTDGPTWDAARNAYIQWDPAQSSWVQWDDASSTWKPIS